MLIFIDQWLRFGDSRWKLHEACLLAMGRCKQLLNDMLVTGYVKIDLDAFVRQVPLADLSQFGKTRIRYSDQIFGFRLSVSCLSSRVICRSIFSVIKCRSESNVSSFIPHTVSSISLAVFWMEFVNY